MAKRKHINAARQEEIEAWCMEPTSFQIHEGEETELQLLHQELNLLIDEQRLALSLLSNAKKLRAHLKQHLHRVS